MPIYGAALMGGGSGPAFAAIGAIYPVGAVCTCSYNGQTLTAKDTSGRALFLVPSAGQWLVKATNGGQEVEDTVSITTQGQVASVTLAFFTATIAVTYPSGSTCTCSDGTTTLTASDTSGSYTFTVPNTGTWTVTATDGDKTKSITVSITTDGQSESVTLNYGLYLFKEGTGLLTGYSVEKLEANGDFSRADYIEWATTSQTDIGNEFQFQPAVDFSGYETLFVDLEYTGRYSSAQTAVVIAITEKFRTGESMSTWNTLSKVSTKNDSYNTNRHTVSIDVTAITSSSCVTIYAFGIAGKLYNLWLE